MILQPKCNYALPLKGDRKQNMPMANIFIQDFLFTTRGVKSRQSQDQTRPKIEPRSLRETRTKAGKLLAGEGAGVRNRKARIQISLTSQGVPSRQL